MASLLSQLKNFWNRTVAVNTHVQSTATPSLNTVAQVRAVDAQNNLNKTTQRVVQQSSGNNWLQQRFQQPTVTSAQQSRATVPPPRSQSYLTPYQSRQSKPLQSYAPPTQYSQEEEVKPTETPKVTQRASSAYRILPDQMERVQTQLNKEMKSTAVLPDRTRMIFDLEPSKPVYYDSTPDGSVVKVTSSKTNFQLFMTPDNRFVAMPLKEDGSVDEVAARLMFRRSNLKGDVIDDYLKNSKPVYAFNGITRLLTGTEVPQTPLHEGVLEDSKPLYFNPILNQFTTEPSFYKVVVNPNKLIKNGQPFEVVPITQVGGEPFILDKDTRKILDKVIDEQMKSMQAMEFIGEVGAPEDISKISSSESVDVTPALEYYNPMKVETGKVRSNTVYITTHDGELQELRLDENLATPTWSKSNERETFSSWLSTLGLRVFGALIASGDVPERAISQSPFVAGDKPTNIFTIISDQFGATLEKTFRNVGIFFSQIPKSYFTSIKMLHEFELKNYQGLLEVTPKEEIAPYSELTTAIARKERTIAKIQEKIDWIDAQVEKAKTANLYTNVRIGLRTLRAADERITFDKALNYYNELSLGFSSEQLSKLDTTINVRGEYQVIQDGKVVSYKEFFKNSPAYKQMIDEFGEVTANKLLYNLLNNKEAFESLKLAVQYRNEFVNSMNFIHQLLPVVSDQKARQALVVADYTNAITNLGYFKSALEGLEKGVYVETPIHSINALVSRSLVAGEEVSQDQVSEVLEFFTGDYNLQKIADVTHRLSLIDNPTFNDLYLVVQQVEQFYYLLNNYWYAKRSQAQINYEALKPFYPSDFTGNTPEEYLEFLKKQTSDTYATLKSYTVNIHKTASAYFDVGQTEKFQQLSKDGLNILRGTFQFERLARGLATGLGSDVYASYSWETTPDRYYQFINNLALAEWSLGRPLNPYEVTQIRDNTIDLAFIMGGQIAFDALNVFDAIQVGTLLKFATKGLGSSLKQVKFVAQFLDAIAESRMVRFFTDLSIRSSVQKASYGIGQFVINAFGDAAFDTVEGGSKYKAVAVIEEAVQALMQVSDVLNQPVASPSVWDEAVSNFITRRSQTALANLPSYVATNERELRKLMQSLSVFVKAEDVTQPEVVAKRISTQLTKAIDGAVFQYNEEVVRRVEEVMRSRRFSARQMEMKLRGIIANAYNKSPESVTWDEIEDALREFTRTMRGDIFPEPADSAFRTVRQEIYSSFEKAVRPEIEKTLSKNRYFVHLVFSISDNFVKYGRDLQRAWGGTSLLADSMLGTLGRKFPLFRPFVKLAGEALDLFMSAWVTATLARRPAWVVFNQAENIFRFIALSIFNPTEYKQMIFGLIPDASRAKILSELGVVPSEIGIDFLPVQTITDEQRFAKFFAGRSIASLSENPFKFFSSHYASNLREIFNRKGWENKLFAPFTAFVSSVQSFNQVIEYGMRLRVYHTLIKRNMRQVLPVLLRALQDDLMDVFEQNLFGRIRNDFASRGLTGDDLENAMKPIQDLIRSYMNDLNIALFENMADPFRVMSMLSQVGTERLRALITLFGGSFNIAPDFFNKTRLVGLPNNYQKVIDIVYNRLTDYVLNNPNIDFGFQNLDTLEDAIRKAIASVRADFNTVYKAMYDYRIRSIFNQVASEVETNFSQAGTPTPPTTPPAPQLPSSPQTPRPPSPFAPNAFPSTPPPIVNFFQEIEPPSQNPLRGVSAESLANEVNHAKENSSFLKSVQNIWERLTKWRKREPVKQVEGVKRVPQVTIPKPAVLASKDDPIIKTTEALERALKERERDAFIAIVAETFNKTVGEFQALSDVEKLRYYNEYADNYLVKTLEMMINGTVPSNPSLADTLARKLLTDSSLQIYNHDALTFYLKRIGTGKEVKAFIDIRGLHATNSLKVAVGDVEFSGYAVGDAYLQTVADIIKTAYENPEFSSLVISNKRRLPRPIPFRQGGDEIVLVFPEGWSKTNANKFVEKLSQVIDTSDVTVTFRKEGKPTPYEVKFSGAKISYGVDRSMSDAESAQTAMKIRQEAEGISRDTYHLKPKTEGVIATYVPPKSKDKQEIAELRRKIDELTTRQNELQKQLEEISQKLDEPKVDTTLITQQTEATQNLIETMNRLTETVQKLQESISNGNAALVLPNGKSGVQVVGEVSDELAPVVAASADEVLENANAVKVTVRTAEDEAQTAVVEVGERAVESSPVVTKTITNRVEFTFKPLDQIQNPVRYFEEALVTGDIDSLRYVLEIFDIETISKAFDFNAGKFLELLQRTLDGTLEVIRGDISQFYSAIALIKYLQEDFTQKLINLKNADDQVRAFVSTVKEALYSSPVISKTKRSTKKAVIESPSLQLKRESSVFSNFFRGLESAGIFEGGDAFQYITERLTESLSESLAKLIRVEDDVVVGINHPLVRLRFDLYYNPNSVEVFEKYMPEIFRKLENLSADTKVSEIIDDLVQDYGEFIKRIISQGGITPAVIDDITNAFAVFMARFERQYGELSVLQLTHDLLREVRAEALTPEGLKELQAKFGFTPSKVKTVFALANTSPLDVMTRINKFYWDILDEKVLQQKSLPPLVRQLLEENREVLKVFTSENEVISSIITTGKSYEIVSETGEISKGLSTRTSRELFERIKSDGIEISAIENEPLHRVFMRSKDIFKGKLENLLQTRRGLLNKRTESAVNKIIKSIDKLKIDNFVNEKYFGDMVSTANIVRKSRRKIPKGIVEQEGDLFKVTIPTNVSEEGSAMIFRLLETRGDEAIEVIPLRTARVGRVQVSVSTQVREVAEDVEELVEIAKRADVEDDILEDFQRASAERDASLQEIPEGTPAARVEVRVTSEQPPSEVELDTVSVAPESTPAPAETVRPSSVETGEAVREVSVTTEISAPSVARSVEVSDEEIAGEVSNRFEALSREAEQLMSKTDPQGFAVIRERLGIIDKPYMERAESVVNYLLEKDTDGTRIGLLTELVMTNLVKSGVIDAGYMKYVIREGGEIDKEFFIRLIDNLQGKSTTQEMTQAIRKKDDKFIEALTFAVSYLFKRGNDNRNAIVDLLSTLNAFAKVTDNIRKQFIEELINRAGWSDIYKPVTSVDFGKVTLKVISESQTTEYRRVLNLWITDLLKSENAQFGNILNSIFSSPFTFNNAFTLALRDEFLNLKDNVDELLKLLIRVFSNPKSDDLDVQRFVTRIYNKHIEIFGQDKLNKILKKSANFNEFINVYINTLANLFSGLKFSDNAETFARYLLQPQEVGVVREVADRLIDEVYLASTIIKNVEMFYAGSDEFKRFVRFALSERNPAYANASLNDIPKADLALAVEDVLTALAEKQSKQSELLAKYQAYLSRVLLNEKLGKSGLPEFVHLINQATQSFENVLNGFDNITTAVRSFLADVGDDPKVGNAYVQSLVDLKGKAVRLNNLIKESVDVEKLTTEELNALNELNAYIEYAIGGVQSFISVMADASRNLFPAPLLLKTKDESSLLYNQLLIALNGIYSISKDTSVVSVAWRDWFARMEGMNKLFANYFDSLYKLTEPFVRQDISRLVTESTFSPAELYRLFTPPSMSEILNSMGIRLELQTSTKSKVRGRLPVWVIQPINNLGVGVGIKSALRVSAESVAREGIPALPALHSALTQTFLGTVSDLATAIRKFNEDNLFEYSRDVFMTLSDVINKSYNTHPLPIPSITILQTASLDTLPKERAEVYRRLRGNLYIFFNTELSPADDKIKKAFTEILDDLANLYYIPTAVVNNKTNQLVKTYQIFFNRIKDVLKKFNAEDGLSIRPLLTEQRIQIIEQILKLQKINGEVLNGLVSGVPSRYALIDAIISALNIHHVSITNQPISLVLKSLSDSPDVAMRLYMIRRFEEYYQMSPKQAEEAYNFTKAVLQNLWKFNNPNSSIDGISDDVLWSWIFDSFGFQKGQAKSVMRLDTMHYHTPLATSPRVRYDLFESFNNLFSVRFRGQAFDNVILDQNGIDSLISIFQSLKTNLEVRVKTSKDSEPLLISFAKEFRRMDDASKTDFRVIIDEVLSYLQTAKDRNQLVSVKSVLDRLSVGIHPLEVTFDSRGNYILKINKLSKKNGVLGTDFLGSLKVEFSAAQIEGKPEFEFIARLLPVNNQKLMLDKSVLDELSAFFSKNGFTKLTWDANINFRGITVGEIALSGDLYPEFIESMYGVTRFALDADSKLKAIINAYESANASTFFHEFYHAVEDFIPPVVRLSIYEEAYQAMKLRYVNDPVMLQVFTPKKFSGFVEAFEQIAKTNDERLIKLYTNAIVDMKEYTVSVFESLILNKVLAQEFAETSVVTKNFAENFKELLITSYSKFRSQLAQGNKNQKLKNVLDKILFTNYRDNLPQIRQEGAKAAEDIFTKLYQVLYRRSSPTNAPPLKQMIRKIPDSAIKFEEWIPNNPASFFAVNAIQFANLVETGKVFNHSKLLETLKEFDGIRAYLESLELTPSQSFTELSGLHSMLMAFAVEKMNLSYDIFSHTNPYSIYRDMRLSDKAVLDYILLGFHELSEEFFDEDTLIYRFTDVLKKLETNKRYFDQTFSRAKAQILPVLGDKKYISSFDNKVRYFFESKFNYHIAFLNDFDFAEVQFLDTYKEAIQELKKLIIETVEYRVKLDPTERSFQTMSIPEYIEMYKRGKFFEYYKEVANFKSSTIRVHQGITSFFDNLMPPDYRVIKDNLVVYGDVSLGELALLISHLPKDDMNKLYAKTVRVHVFGGSEPVLTFTETGKIDVLVTSNADTTFHAKLPVIYLGNNEPVIEIFANSFAEIAKLNTIEDVVHFLVTRSPEQVDVRMRNLILSYAEFLSGYRKQVELISQPYIEVSNKIVNYIPPEWVEGNEIIRAGQRLLDSIDKTAHPEEYAQALAKLREISLRELSNTQYTFDRMNDIVREISRDFWWQVRTFFTIDGMKEEDVFGIVRRAIDYELRGMTPHDAILQAITDRKGMEWLDVYFNAGYLKITPLDSPKSAHIIFDKSKVRYWDELYDKSLSSNASDMLKSDVIITWNDLKDFTLEEIFADRDAKIFKRDILTTVDNLLDDYDSIYLIQSGVNTVSNFSLQVQVDYELRQALAEFSKRDDYLVIKNGMDSYIVISKNPRSSFEMAGLKREFSERVVAINGGRDYSYRLGVLRYSKDDISKLVAQREREFHFNQYSSKYETAPISYVLKDGVTEEQLQKELTYKVKVVYRNPDIKSKNILLVGIPEKKVPVFILPEFTQGLEVKISVPTFDFDSLLAGLELDVFTESDIKKIRQLIREDLGMFNRILKVRDKLSSTSEFLQFDFLRNILHDFEREVYDKLPRNKVLKIQEEAGNTISTSATLEQIGNLVRQFYNSLEISNGDLDELVDYILSILTMTRLGITRAYLPDGSLFFVHGDDFIQMLPNEDIVRNYFDVYDFNTPISKVNSAKVVDEIISRDASLLDVASKLDSDLYSLDLSKSVAENLGIPIDYLPPSIEFNQAVRSSNASTNLSWEAFTNFKFFPIKDDYYPVSNTNGSPRTRLVSLRELLMSLNADHISASNFLYRGVDEFIAVMEAFLNKLQVENVGVEYQELVSNLLTIARSFKRGTPTMSSFSRKKAVRQSLQTLQQNVIPQLNLVFDYDVWNMVSDSMFVAFDFLGMRNTLDRLENVLVDNLTRTNNFLKISREMESGTFKDEFRNSFKEVDNLLGKYLQETWQAANYGGKAVNGLIDIESGAINEMNRIMIDYFSTSRADEWMKMIMPFWMYPARSLPYWLDLILQHPEIMSFYAKYRKWSDHINWQDGGVASDGSILPSLDGYVPLTFGVYFNPLAPFLFRFVAPQIRDLPETRDEEDMGVFQHVARFILDIAPQYGFSISPILQAIMMNFYEPYYPKTSLIYEFIRSILPIEWIPPLIERSLRSKLRQITKTDMPELWRPEVRWFDYLVEQEILSQALADMNTAVTDEEKRKIAVRARELILDPNREEHPDWIRYSDEIKNRDWVRQMAGNFTGVYTKTLSPERAALLELRSNANKLRESINNMAKASIFELYDTPSNLYAKFNDFRFNTPEGNLYQLYQMTRYVVDPNTGKFAQGDERLRLMIANDEAEQATQLYYKEIERENERYRNELATIRVGDTEARKKAREEHLNRLLEIRTNPAFSNARRTRFVSPIKPRDALYKDIYNDWWFVLTADEPKFSDYEDYDAYAKAKEEWLDSIKETADLLYPMFVTNLMLKAMEGNISDERRNLLKKLAKEVYEQTSREAYEQFRSSSKTVYDAVWDAYQELYVDPFYKALEGKKGYEYELAKQEYLLKNPAPNKEAIIQYIQEKFGDKFTRAEIAGVFKSAPPLTIPEKEDATKTQLEKDASEALRILQNAGNQSSPLFKDFKRTYLLMGGKESDFDVIWATGGRPDNFSDVQRFYEIFNRMKAAAQQAGVPDRLSIPELRERIEVSKLNDIFKAAVVRELGEEFYSLMAYYYDLSEREQRAFRKENPELYAKIQKYYRMRDEFSKVYPLWGSYYNPNFDPTKPVSGSGSGYVSSGGYYRRTSRSGSIKRIEDTTFLHMGKRATLDSMRLFLDNVLGRGGAEKRPILTDELRSLIGERASAEIEEGKADKLTAKYLDKLAKANPAKSAQLKELATKIRRGGDLRYVRDINKFQ